MPIFDSVLRGNARSKSTLSPERGVSSARRRTDVSKSRVVGKLFATAVTSLQNVRRRQKAAETAPLAPVSKAASEIHLLSDAVDLWFWVAPFSHQ